MNEAPDRSRSRQTASRRSPWGLLLLAAASSVVLAGLGSWQLQRLGWKEALIAERQASLAAPPVALDTLADTIPAWRRLQLNGVLLNDRSLLVGPRSYRGLPHWRLVTPLRLAGGGIVLVDRGWVPDRGKNAAFAGVSKPAGPVSFDGVLRRPAPSGYFSPDNVPDADIWFRVDPEAMAARLGLTGVAPFWVVAQAGDGGQREAGSYPIADTSVSMPSNNHLSYAITWFGLSLGSLAVAGFYWRRERRSTS